MKALHADLEGREKALSTFPISHTTHCEVNPWRPVAGLAGID